MSKFAFDRVKHAAQKLGVAISYYPPPGSYERHLRDFIAEAGINVVLDIGAYTGDWARELRKIGYSGRIISFEPVSASYERLCAAMHEDPEWSGEPFGLSNENRIAQIHTYSKGDFNSLLNLREDAEQAYSLDHSCRSETSITLKRLDAVLPQLLEGIKSPQVFMKMDTQGHDISVMEGASGVLGTIRGIQSELPAVEIYDGMVSMPEALSYFASRGFVPTGFYPVNTFRDLQITPEFDILLNRFEGRLERD